MNNRPAELRERLWRVRPQLAASQSTVPGIHPVLVQVLHNRGFTTPAQIQSFMQGRYLESDDPFLLTDMDKAVARIQQAVENDECIIVYGDFDADGVTSTVLLTEALRGLGVKRSLAQPYIPDRVDEGYGLNKEALTKLRHEKKADLVISVDCGIRSVDEVEHANVLGLDMIITDHHSIGAQLPPAVAVINPKRTESDYPEKMLAGVGIAWKLAQALHRSMPQRSALDLRRLLDLVAIGTVADLAPLTGENRRLVIDGLKVMNDTRRPGLVALAETCNLKSGSIQSETIAFMIGPRINAAGRLSHAYDAAKLLAAHSMPQALTHARALEQLNRQRQRLTEDLTAKAEALVDPDAPILIAAGDDFLAGVVGLVASRLMDKYYRPTIILERGEEESRASCRSIDAFHITNALEQVSHLLVRYGGHAQAAGFTIKNEHLDQFIAEMTTLAREALEGRDLKPTLEIDAEIELDDIDWALHKSLQYLEPTGQRNRRPLFMTRSVNVVSHRVVGRDGTHLQLEVNKGANGLKSIAFRQAAWASMMPEKVDIAYALDVNEWRGRRTLQLQIKDIRAAKE